MKKHLFIKIIAVMLIVATLFSATALTASALIIDNDYTEITDISISQRNTFLQTNTNFFVMINRMSKEEKSYFKKSVEELKSVKTADQAVSTVIDSIFEIATDPDNVNWKDVGLEAGAKLINLAASCFGFGGIAESITGGLLKIFKDKSPSEIQLLKEHLDKQFSIVNQGIADIRNDISELSVDIDKSFIDAVKKMEDAVSDSVAADMAGEDVIAFTSSDSGYFNYNSLKNYLYGNSQDPSNRLSEFAYYDKLSRAIAEGKSDAVIEEYYNALYQSLMTNGQVERDPYINVMRDYIMAEGNGMHSIQRDYYDWLLYNRENIKSIDKDKDVEWEAILFTLDVYRTMLGAEHCMLVCDNYFLSQIYLTYGPNPNSENFYEYISPTGIKTHVKYGDLIVDIERYSNAEYKKALTDQIVKDIVYIFNMENSYMLESVDGDFYPVNNVSSDTFGQVRNGQTVYMNRLNDEVCEIFGFDPQKFTYVWTDAKGKTIEENTGMFTVPTGYKTFNATLYYDGTEIYTTPFEVDNNKTFCGGNGTAIDPYLISTVSQFNMIETGEASYNTATNSGVHYKIINDIDFNNAERAPLGDKDNPFDGVLDGDGHILRNLNITAKQGTQYIGLFAIVSLHSTIKNITMENASISANDQGTHEILAGGISGTNHGKIENCHVKNSEIKITRSDNNSKNKKENIVTRAGGISGNFPGGVSHGNIKDCSVVSSTISVDSHRAYAYSGNHEIYVGGICSSVYGLLPQITNCVVEGTTIIKGNATCAIPMFIIPWPVTVKVGGIAAENGLLRSFFRKICVTDDVSIEATTNIAEKNNEKFILKEYTLLPNTLLTTNWPRDAIVFPEFDYQSAFSYDGEKNTEYNYNQNQVYKYDEDFLKTTETYLDNGIEEEKNILNMSVSGTDGFTIDSYEILGYYGLNTLDSDKVDGKEHTVTVVFNAILTNGSEEDSEEDVEEGSEEDSEEENVITKNRILSVDIPIIVEKIKPTELVIKTMPKTQYNAVGDKITLDNGEFELLWEDGTSTSVTPEIVGSKTTTSLGTSEVEISYKDISTTYKINVECIHKYVETITNPTCDSEGYTKAICSQCGDAYIVSGSITDKVEHTIVIKNAVTATCNTNGSGYTGDKWCSVCNKMVEKGTAINVLQHEYEYIDGNSCKCKVCKNDNTTKPHEYTSVENTASIIYSCATCGYTYTVEKKTTTDITRVVVGNSYGLVNSDNEIVVYIKMFNNPGITGVSFRIEYDNRLEYVRYERGDLLLAASEFEVAQADGVIGFVAASPDVHGADGNLLKLVFKLPDGAKVMDSYDISIAYTRKQFTGGQANAIDIVTMGGSITAVTHLPGDVNNDGVVDVLDTALVARYVAISNTKDPELLKEFLENQNHNFNEFYGDVNLDEYVDISDLVTMLQYFVGKNVQELISNEFEVILNPNNGSLDLDSIVVKCYDEDGTRGVYPTLPTPTRPGYRFDGWYLSFDVSNLDTERINSGDKVYYNPSYLKQTLYAHWTEIYTVKYDINAPANASSASGTMEDSLYEYDEKKALRDNGFNIVGWKFKGWATYAGGPVVYQDGAEVSGLAHAGETITLYAVWEANTYTVKFRSNQPSSASGVLYGSMESVNCVYDTATTLDNVDYRLTGWTFKGWATSVNGDVVYNDGANIKNLTDADGTTLTFYAVWEANSYNVEFDKNKPAGASGSVDGNVSGMNCTYDSSYIFPANEYTLGGWKFKGWSLNANGTGQLYNPETSFSNLSSEDDKKLVFYAVWEPIPYTVIFNGNGANGSMNSSEHVYDTVRTLPGVGFIKTGYQFVGWNTKSDGSGVGYSDKAQVTNLVSEENGSITLYAQWLPGGYIVYYAPNGGTGTPTHSTHTFDVQDNLTANSFSKDGYQFDGWNTKADGSGDSYSDKATFKNLVESGNGSITLYAQWKANSYAVQFNSNKPSTASGQIVGTMNNLNCTYDVNTSLGAVKYSLTGWTFKGWSTTKNGAVVYKDNATVNNLTEVDGKTVTLYAVWEANKYSVVFNANKPANASGTVGGTMSTINMIYDTASKLPSTNYSLTGWTFMGWATTANGTVVYKNAVSVTNLSSKDGGKINLYAVWSANTYSVIYNANTGTGTMSSSAHTYDVSASLSPNKFIKPGSSFVGWNTSADGKGSYYWNGASVKNLSSAQNGAVTLYAIWGVDTYTITFVTDGGSSVAPLQYVYGDITSAPASPTKAGFDFVEWTFDDSNFAFGKEMPNHHIVATAVWTYKSVSYDSGYEAKKIDASYTYDYDSFSISDLAPFMKAGYKLEFKIAVYMWEENEGYQEIYLINSNGTNIAGNAEFAHGGSGTDGAAWEYFTFTVEGENCTNTMKLRYGAHGKGSDDWYRGRAQAIVTVIKE